MYSAETEIYTLATCPGTKYSGDMITLRSTPRDGIGPYYVAFKKDGIIIDPSRLGGESNPILNAPENVEIMRTYTLDDEDVRNALASTIDFSVFIRGSCPTGGGLQFDGVDDYVDAGNATSLNITNSITIEAWVKTPQPTKESQMIVTRSDGSANAQYEFAFLGSTGKLGFASRIGGVFNWYSANTVLLENTWYHAVVTFNGTQIKWYLNEIDDGTVNIAGTMNSQAQPVQIGARNDGATTFRFNGTIDEVLIYNRALSPTEILELYNGSTPRNGLVLEHIYSLGNANDLSGYGNNGTPINGPVFIPNACMDTCTIAIGCIAPVCNFVVT